MDRLETSAGPCFVNPVTHPHLHCSLPIGHEGLHQCFTSVGWGECSGIELDTPRHAAREALRFHGETIQPPMREVVVVPASAIKVVRTDRI